MVTTSENSIRTTRRPTMARVSALAGGAIAALVVFGLSTIVVDDLRQPAFGDAQPQPLDAGIVTLMALVGGGLGWAVLAGVERWSARPRRTWAVMGPLGLLVSLAGPLSGHGVTAGNRAALALMHVAVAAVVIPVLHRSARPVRQGR